MTFFQTYTSAASGSSFSAFSKALNGLGGQLLIYAGVLAAIGTIAMAIVEMVKSVCLARLHFNHWRVQKWTKSESVIAELELLSVGAHTKPAALYDQPVEKMMGQIQAAANLVLEYPEAYPNLYNFLVEVPKAYWDRGSHDATRDDGRTWREGKATVFQVRSNIDNNSAKDISIAQDATAAKARLHNMVARKLDALQNQTQYMWERANQWSATVVGVVVFLVAVAVSDRAPTDAGGWAVAFLIALPSGVVAPFAKQLAGSLSSFRR